MRRAEIERECRGLVLAATYFGDHGQADEATALFTGDATWRRGERDHAGLAEIRASYDRFSPTQVIRHMIGGTVVTVVDDDHASAVTYYLALHHDPGVPDPEFPLPLEPFSAGEWHDTFVRTPSGWRFATRATRRVFERRSD
jgi:hypothetical protein